MNTLYGQIATFLAGKFGWDAAKIREALEREFSPDYALHVWQVEDVFWSARRNGYPMSRSAAQEILSRLEDKVDSEFGITWDTVGTTIGLWLADQTPDDLLAAADDLKGGFALVSENGEFLWTGVGALQEAAQKGREAAEKRQEVVYLASVAYDNSGVIGWPVGTRLEGLEGGWTFACREWTLRCLFVFTPEDDGEIAIDDC